MGIVSRRRALLVTMANSAQADQFGVKDHWRCLGAVTLVSVASFQYGLDFGIIGGLQAMVGFLKVRVCLVLFSLALHHGNGGTAGGS